MKPQKFNQLEIEEPNQNRQFISFKASHQEKQNIYKRKWILKFILIVLLLLLTFTIIFTFFPNTTTRTLTSTTETINKPIRRKLPLRTNEENEKIVKQMKERFQKDKEIKKQRNFFRLTLDRDHHVSNQIHQISKQYVRIKTSEPSDYLIEKERAYYEQKYNMSAFTKEIPICVVAPSFNNVRQDRYIKHLNSLMRQRYKNYRVIYIDDASTDNTGALVQKYIQERNISKEKLHLIRNKKNIKAMQNLKIASYEFCEPHQIYLVVAGDDFLTGVYALQMVNLGFQVSDAWIVYGPQVSLAELNLRFSLEFIDEQFFIDKKYRSSNLETILYFRAFYNQLFRQIKDKDLKYQNGTYIQETDDIFIAYPIIQMAQFRMHQLPEILYAYNNQSELNAIQIHPQTQNFHIGYAKSKLPYEKLECLFRDDNHECSKLSVSDYALWKSNQLIIQKKI